MPGDTAKFSTSRKRVSAGAAGAAEAGAGLAGVGTPRAPGFPGAALSDAQHRERFDDCVAYAPHRLPAARVERLVEAIERLSALDDARQLATLLIAPR